MVTLFALLALCEEDPVTDAFPFRKITDAEFDVYFVVSPNKLFNK